MREKEREREREREREKERDRERKIERNRDRNRIVNNQTHGRLKSDDRYGIDVFCSKIESTDQTKNRIKKLRILYKLIY